MVLQTSARRSVVTENFSCFVYCQKKFMAQINAANSEKKKINFLKQIFFWHVITTGLFTTGRGKTSCFADLFLHDAMAVAVIFFNSGCALGRNDQRSSFLSVVTIPVIKKLLLPGCLLAAGWFQVLPNLFGVNLSRLYAKKIAEATTFNVKKRKESSMKIFCLASA